MEQKLLLKIKMLEEENLNLKSELEYTKEHLKKYTAPSRHKIYYENHKEELLSKQKTYIVSPEKKKEYARRAYLKKKEKACVSEII